MAVYKFLGNSYFKVIFGVIQKDYIRLNRSQNRWLKNNRYSIILHKKSQKAIGFSRWMNGSGFFVS